MLNALRPFLLIAASLVTLPALAQESAPPPGNAAAPPIQIRSQREDAGARVRQVERAGGRVLQAEPMQSGGQEVYRFKVLTPEGRVRVMQGDPRSVGPAPSRDDRTERRREQQIGFDRRSELTGRRRDFRDDPAQDGRSERQPPPDRPTQAAGEPARD